jgi:hypothetical protein
MIVVRNVFKLKFGHAKEAVSAWKEMIGMADTLNFGAREMRLFTDAVADFYTVVFEVSFDSMGHYEEAAKRMMSNAQWGQAYQKITPHVESGYREIFNRVDI